MKISRVTIYVAAATLAAAFLCARISSAQGTPGSAINSPLSVMNEAQGNREVMEDLMRQGLGDAKEQAAYVAFQKVTDDQPDKKIKLGDGFLAKYPNDRYSQAVYEELAQTYYAKKDLQGFYYLSDKGISLFPDDVHLLALTGWVIPRAFDPKDPEADKRLDRAENYEKHAIDVLGTMPKPQVLTDDQFAQFKAGEKAVALSGLGLIYFRREQYETSAQDLQQATAAEAKPDPTDFFILGADLENTGKWKEAADAFNRCAQLGGAMQDTCKQQAAKAAKNAGDSK
jgi:tetratricopeptide (TPR) repeat protein